MDWLGEARGQPCHDYAALHRWSVQQPDAFWRSIWDWCGVRYDGDATRVTDGAPMPHTRWFPDARVNYAEHVLRHEEQAEADGEGGRIAFHHASEAQPLRAMSLRELGSGAPPRHPPARTRRAAGRSRRRLPAQCARLRRRHAGHGQHRRSVVVGGDRLRRALGGGPPAPDRSQVLIAADGYRFGGKDFARRDEVVQIAQALPSLQQLVWLPVLGGGVPADLPDLPCRVQAWDALLAGPEVPRAAFCYARVWMPPTRCGSCLVRYHRPAQETSSMATPACWSST